MNKIKTAAIIGAGALGLLYCGLMKKKLANNCYFLTDGQRYERIKTGRFEINGKKEVFNVINADVLKSDKQIKPDLILVAVKNHHLPETLSLLEKAVGNDTIIISVLNGIESEVFLREQFPAAQVISTVAVGMDAVKEGSSLYYTKSGKLLIGAEGNDKSNSHLIKLAGFFDSCNMAYEIPDDIERSVWWKWMINIGVNQVSAVTGANYGVFHTDRDIQLLMESAMQEAIETAKAAGVDLRNNDIENWYPILNSLGPDNKTSMLQDIEACRKTEVEAFSGRLIEISSTYNIDVPVNKTLFRIIKTKELLYRKF